MATIYYIDYENGNDANNGTSKATPWKHCPGMRPFVRSYTHGAGDQFIFKGGVTWPHDALPIYINKGGSSTLTRDIYGVDETWFSVEWTRPKLDAQGITLPAGHGPVQRENVIWIKGSSSKTVGAHIEIVGLEITGHVWNDPVPTSNTDGLGIYLDSTDDIIIDNVYIHDWVVNSNVGSDFGGMLAFNFTNTSAINCIIKGPTTFAPEFVGTGTSSGSGIQVFTLVQGCDIENTSQGVWSCRTVRDTSIHDGGNDHTNGIPGADIHENAVWATGWCDFYNNKVYNWAQGVGAYFLVGWGGASNTRQNVYNNVFANTAQINLTNQASGTATNQLYFVNNTVVQSSFCIQVGTTKAGAAFGKLRIQNNLFITPVTAIAIVDAGDLGADYVPSNNVTMSPADATTNGLVLASFYKPATEIAAIVDQGVNLSAIFTTDIEYAQRPDSPDAWTVGAYEFAPVGGKIIVLSPDPAEFGQVLSGTVDQRNLRVTNTGDATLTVSGVSYPTGFSGLTTGFTVAAGAFHDILITFSPVIDDYYFGDMVVTSDATGGNGTVVLSGEGIGTPAVVGKFNRTPSVARRFALVG